MITMIIKILRSARAVDLVTKQMLVRVYRDHRKTFTTSKLSESGKTEVFMEKVKKKKL